MIRTIRIIAVVSTMLASGTALAQTSDDTAAQGNGSNGGGIAEIVVTAQKRAENLQSTPLAISALTSEALTASGITNLAGVAAVTPSIYSAPYPNSSNTLSYFIRGQGAADPMQITRDGAVGIYVDGVFVNRPQTSTIDLADIERIEVLRGPQGTLYGRNTTGGAVSVISRKPTGEAEVRGKFTYGNRDRVRGLVNVDLPAMGDFAIKLTGLFSRVDGYAKNPNRDSNDFQFERQVAGRVAARWTPSADVTVDYSYEIGKVSNTPILYVNPGLVGVVPGYDGDGYRAYQPVNLPLSTTNFNDHTLNVEWVASDSLTLRSISGYRRVKFIGHQEFAGAYGYGLTGLEDVRSRQYSQEFQAVGSIGDRIEYVAGLYYFRERASHYQEVGIDFSADLIIHNYRNVRALSISEAAYGQLTWTPPVLGDRLKLTVGGRYTHDKRNSTRDYLDQYITTPDGTIVIPKDPGTSNRQRFSRFNPSFVASMAFSDNINGYARVATGYKAGGANEGSPNFAVTFGPEKVTSYEIGLKTDLLDRRLRVNLAGFITDYRGIQLDQSLDPQDPSVTATTNAGKARISGIEADVTARPFRDLTLSVSYAYLHTKISRVTAGAGTVFDPVVNPSSPYQVGDNIASLYVIPFAPQHAVTLTGDWTFLRFDSGKLTAHADYRWKDDAFATSGAGPAVPGREKNLIPAYGLLDARVTLEREWNGRPFTFSLWGRNITDKRHVIQGNGIGGILTGYADQVFAYSEPATYGVEIGFDF
ncbi:hypothetical protein MB02_07735 [Croceicoccus estronivorus]|uniref:TonB-dependent receptor n=1 Tax=Croceicoccus estronivorus TaxID=1172626 RepID=UPI000832D241|nr:TonB-dependent receptor [Croceicoccus estronivorus]OCC24153.1 hypothetical protein MB02_07735 [Croceicoccus estronivorus]